MSRIPGERLHGTTAASIVIPTRNRPHGLQKSRRKNRRSQKSSVWMMKRRSRTGAQPRPGSPGAGAGAGRRNGSLRNGPTIPTAINGPGIGRVLMMPGTAGSFFFGDSSIQATSHFFQTFWNAFLKHHARRSWGLRFHLRPRH